MKKQVSAAKWMGMLLLQIPVYLVTSNLMRSLIGGCYRLLIKADANMPPQLLLQHFLLVSMLDGFLAGVLGVAVFRAIILLPIRIQIASGPGWKRPQAWIWAISTCWLAFGILIWVATNSHRSVLATSRGIGFPDAIRVFFGTGCYLPAANLTQSVLGSCMTQLSYTHPWLGTIGYSAAAFIPAAWFNRLHNPSVSAEQLEVATDKQRPEQQTQPGEVSR